MIRSSRRSLAVFLGAGLVYIKIYIKTKTLEEVDKKVRVWPRLPCESLGRKLQPRPVRPARLQDWERIFLREGAVEWPVEGKQASLVALERESRRKRQVN